MPKKDAKLVEQSLKSASGENLLVSVREIVQKKEILDEINVHIDELTNVLDNLNKRITLLSNEAKLLEIRTISVPSTPQIEDKKKEIRKEFELSAQEELEFQKKREELKALIKKLWEQ